MNRLQRGIDPFVFWGSALLMGAFVVWGLLAPKHLGSVMTSTLGWIIQNFGWGFILIAAGGLVMCIFLVLHPWGRIRLGPDESRPEVRTFSGVSMMFAAGLGACDRDRGRAWVMEPYILSDRYVSHLPVTVS